MLLISCTVPVKQSDIDAANYPTKPTQRESDTQIRAHLNSVLKDPDSVKMECQPIRKGWARQYRDREAEFGWIASCMVNAKNSYGTYVGSKPYYFLFTTNGLTVVKGTFQDIKLHIGYHCCPVNG